MIRPMDFSTFAQFVFCVRIAPTATSKGVSPGHQCSGPNVRFNVR